MKEQTKKVICGQIIAMITLISFDLIISVPLCLDNLKALTKWEKEDVMVTDSFLTSNDCNYTCCYKRECYNCESTCWYGIVEINGVNLTVTESNCNPYEAELQLKLFWLNNSIKIYQNPNNISDFILADKISLEHCKMFVINIPIMFILIFFLVIALILLCEYWTNLKKFFNKEERLIQVN